MMALALVAAVQLAGANAALEKCHKLDKEFDTKAMPKPCQAAADDTTLTVPERVDALRLLAFAHILNGDEALAEPAFLRMLVFSPTVDLPADAGPQFREPFAAVKKRFETEGQLQATFNAPQADPAARGPVALQVDLADKLGRVVGARVRSTVSGGGTPLEDRLVRSELSPGQLRFSGVVPEPTTPDAYSVTYEIIFDGWDGTPIPLAAPLTGSVSRNAQGGDGAVAAAGELPWGWIIGGSAAVVVAGGATAGGVAWCFTIGPCRQQNAWVRVQVRQ